MGKLNGWTGKVIAVLAAAGVIGSIKVYASQGVIEERVDKLEQVAVQAGKTREDMVELRAEFKGFRRTYDRDRSEAKEERGEILRALQER